MDALSHREISVGDWFVTLILLCLPVVNFIMLLVWAFGGGAPAAKRNFSRAYLVLWLIFSALAVVLLLILLLLGVLGTGSLLFFVDSMVDSMYQY